MLFRFHRCRTSSLRCVLPVATVSAIMVRRYRFGDYDDDGEDPPPPTPLQQYIAHLQSSNAGGTSVYWAVASGERPRIDFLSEPLDTGAMGDRDLQCSVKQLLSMSEQAPLGKGEETVVDLSIRKTRKIPSTKIRVEWAGLEAAVKEAYEQLRQQSAPTCRWVAKFHDVLIYQSGDFFREHRDSKKGPNHIATMSVVLKGPRGCSGGGGDVIFPEANTTWSLETMDSSKSDETAWCAWFASELHSVSPVVDGQRVVATYNIFEEPADESQATPEISSQRQLPLASEGRCSNAEEEEDEKEEVPSRPLGRGLGSNTYAGQERLRRIAAEKEEKHRIATELTSMRHRPEGKLRGLILEEVGLTLASGSPKGKPVHVSVSVLLTSENFAALMHSSHRRSSLRFQMHRTLAATFCRWISSRTVITMGPNSSRVLVLFLITPSMIPTPRRWWRNPSSNQCNRCTLGMTRSWSTKNSYRRRCIGYRPPWGPPPHTISS